MTYEEDCRELLRTFRDPSTRDETVRFLLEVCPTQQIVDILDLSVAQSGETEGAYDICRALLLRSLEELRAPRGTSPSKTQPN